MLDVIPLFSGGSDDREKKNRKKNISEETKLSKQKHSGSVLDVIPFFSGGSDDRKKNISERTKLSKKSQVKNSEMTKLSKKKTLWLCTRCHSLL